MSTRKRFPDLERLARERGYTLERLGREVLWWRNSNPRTVLSSSGVSAAWDDIILDSSSKEPVGSGLPRTTPGENP